MMDSVKLYEKDKSNYSESINLSYIREKIDENCYSTFKLFSFALILKFWNYTLTFHK